MCKRELVAALLLTNAYAGASGAEDADAPPTEHAPSREGDEAPTRRPLADLLARATDPTSSPLTLGFTTTIVADSYADAAGERPEQGYTVEFQPVVPYRVLGLQNLLRLSLPYRIAGEDGAGFDEVEAFTLVVIPTPMGRVAGGLTTTLEPGSGTDPGVFSAGPALGYSLEATSALQVGVFVENWFASGVARSRVRPILSLTAAGWSLSTGEMDFEYDWTIWRLTRIPVRVELAREMEIGEGSVRIAAAAEYNFADLPGAERVVLELDLELLLPE